MEVIWKAKSTPNQEQIISLSKEINVSLPIATILVQRGIDTYQRAKDFFRPQITDLHDPFLMKDMDKAYTRLKEAVYNGEGMMVYGDYDVDGTTAVSIVYSYFVTLNPTWSITYLIVTKRVMVSVR